MVAAILLPYICLLLMPSVYLFSSRTQKATTPRTPTRIQQLSVYDRVKKWLSHPEPIPKPASRYEPAIEPKPTRRLALYCMALVLVIGLLGRAQGEASGPKPNCRWTDRFLYLWSCFALPILYFGMQPFVEYFYKKRPLWDALWTYTYNNSCQPLDGLWYLLMLQEEIEELHVSEIEVQDARIKVSVARSRSVYLQVLGLAFALYAMFSTGVLSSYEMSRLQNIPFADKYSQLKHMSNEELSDQLKARTSTASHPAALRLSPTTIRAVVPATATLSHTTHNH